MIKITNEHPVLRNELNTLLFLEDVPRLTPFIGWTPLIWSKAYFNINYVATPYRIIITLVTGLTGYKNFIGMAKLSK